MKYFYKITISTIKLSPSARLKLVSPLYARDEHGIRRRIRPPGAILIIATHLTLNPGHFKSTGMDNWLLNCCTGICLYCIPVSLIVKPVDWHWWISCFSRLLQNFFFTFFSRVLFNFLPPGDLCLDCSPEPVLVLLRPRLSMYGSMNLGLRRLGRIS